MGHVEGGVKVGQAGDAAGQQRGIDGMGAVLCGCRPGKPGQPARHHTPWGRSAQQPSPAGSQGQLTRPTAPPEPSPSRRRHAGNTQHAILQASKHLRDEPLAGLRIPPLSRPDRAFRVVGGPGAGPRVSRSRSGSSLQAQPVTYGVPPGRRPAGPPSTWAPATPDWPVHAGGASTSRSCPQSTPKATPWNRKTTPTMRSRPAATRRAPMTTQAAPTPSTGGPARRRRGGDRPILRRRPLNTPAALASCGMFLPAGRR
jgi:hypothetical protein